MQTNQRQKGNCLDLAHIVTLKVFQTGGDVSQTVEALKRVWIFICINTYKFI